MNTAWRLPRLILAATVGWGLALGSPHALAGRGGSAVARSPEATRALAIVQQETLPALESRRAAALARSQALDSWFAGTQPTPAAALPELAGRALLDPSAIWGELRALDRTAEVRASERIAPPPPDLHPADFEALAATRTATLDAEDATDARVRRFWSGLLAATERAPKLQNSAVRTRTAALEERTPPPSTIGPDGPSDADADAAVGRARAQAGLLTLQAAAVRAATIPGDPTLDALVQGDVVRIRTHLQLPPDAASAPSLAVLDAADRLDRAAPLTSVELTGVLEAWTIHILTRELEALVAEQSVLEARVTSDIAEANSVSIDVAQNQLETARSGMREAQASRAALRTALGADQDPAPDLGAPDSLRLQTAELLQSLAGLRVQLAEQTLDRATRQAESIRSIQDTTDDDVAKAQADAAAKEAEAARAAEQRSAEAEIRQMVAEFSKQRATILEARKKREEAARTMLDAHISALQSQRTNLAAALSLGPLDQNRQHRLDDVYRSARVTVTEVREDHTTLRSARNALLMEVATLHQSLPEPTDYKLPGAGSTLVTDLTHEIEMLHAALDRDIDIADRDLDASMALLAEAKALRRLALTHASSDARSVVQSKFFDELIFEIGEVPFVVMTALRRGFTLVRHLPTLVLDLGVVATFIWGSIELVVLLLLWGMGRKRTSEWLTQGLTALTAVRPGDLGLIARANDWVISRGVAGNWLNLNAVLLPALLRILDLIAGVLVYNELPDTWIYLRLAVFIWLLRAVWLLGNDLVPVLLVTPAEDRPGARSVSAPGRRRALRTVQLVLTWAVLTALFSRIALDILDADRLHDLVDALGTAAGWVIAVATLHKWAPDLRHSVARDPDDALGRLLVQQSDSTLLRAPIAGLAVVVLTIRQVSGLLTSLVDRRSGLAWVRTAMARQSLKNTDDAPTQRLHPTLRSRLARFNPADVSTDAETALLAAAFADWKQEGRRGMVAVTGQRGSGKSRLICRVPEIVGTGEGSLPIHRVRLDRDIFDPADALAWLITALSGQTDTPPAGDPATAIRLLDKLPPTVFVVDDLHRCFLRAVGGYRGLREVLTTMHAVSDRHFWVCSFHGDNWAYLEGIGQAVNLGVFRTRVAMQPLTPTELRDWLEAHTRASGLEPTYDDLAAEGWIGSDPERARQRARNAYFRLLAESTRGNPRVALETWTRSLRLGETEDTTAVVLFDQPDAELLDQGGKHALFVLAALVVHDGLDVRHLVRVLNLHEASCRATCRRLEGLGVLTSDAHDEHYDITMAWGPAVHRHLRRKHLLHRE